MDRNWIPLKEGDIIDIIAPSSGVPKDGLEESLYKIDDFISSLNLRARIDFQNIITPGVDPFSANSKKYRYEKLKEAILAKDSKAIWCIRGGYGAALLLDDLSKLTRPTTAKLLIGFSDITALHLFVNTRWHWNSLHARVLWQFINNSPNRENSYIEDIKAILFGQKNEISYSIEPMNKQAEIANNINAFQTIGGNMAVIQTSIGTQWQMNAAGNVIFFEDTDERGYKVDRILNHFKQSKILDGAKAIIFGDFVYKGLNEHIEKELIEKSIKRFSLSTSTPVYRIANIGHGEKNYPLPFGFKTNISLHDKKYILKVIL
jgi:muramoyltetrapeptide carboxypeptidase